MRTLPEEESNEFLRIHKHLILFTNQQYGIYKQFKTIEDLSGLNEKDKTEGIRPIREKMYKKGNIDTFCQQNPFCLKEQELGIALTWKNHLSIQAYMMRHLKDYTVFFTEEENNLYGIKSITTDLADLYPSSSLPSLVDMIILPFKGHLVYDGFLLGYGVSFGSGIREELNSEFNIAKALHGIYSSYKAGDSLANPPETSSLKDKVDFSIKQSLKRNEFPARALSLAEEEGERALFEHSYSKHFITAIKKAKKYNEELPKMYYAIYRDCCNAYKK